MSGSAAARVGDPIAHSHAGLGMMLGLAAGVVAGVVLVGATVATGGAALAVVAAVGGAAGLASFGGLKGMHIGEASMGPPCGAFITGAPNVLINGRPATFTAGAFATCSKESGGPIPLATGAATVTITAGLAGRVGETLGCSAKSVSAASPDVVIGGPSAADPAVTINPEVPGWAVTGLQALGVAGALLALPYSVVTLGVAGTVGVGALGMVGSAVGGRAMRAAGEAMGMSEAGVRAMEAAGELGGGLLAGRAGARKFGTPLPPEGETPASEPFPFTSKKVGQTEPGAVPNTPELQAEMDAAASVGARSAPGYPDLPADKARTFGDDVRPWNGDEQPGPIRRVIGRDADANGGYWQSEVPQSEAEWRGGAAVLNDWNGNGGYVESPPQGLRGWIGSARPQMSSDGVSVLPGHGEQIWIPPGSANPGTPIPTPWSNK